MESMTLLPSLTRLPASDVSGSSVDELLEICHKIDGNLLDTEIGLGVQKALQGLFDWRHVPDSLRNAHAVTYPGCVPDLHQHYCDVAARGESAIRGFVSGLKGKLAEFQACEILPNRFPGFNFELAADPTNPVWDLHGIAADGSELFVQVKLGSASYVSDITHRMLENPDTHFAVGHEIYASIMSHHPELASQLVDLNISNLDFTHDVHENLALLAENHGIDVPDSVGDFLPHISEVVLGIRLLWDIVSVNREFATVSLNDKSRLCGMKAIVLFSRFGITTVCTTAASAAGSALFPGAGTIVGSISGAVAAGLLNRKLQPRMLDVGMWLVGVSKDDLFYFQNKVPIDQLGASFEHTSQSLVAWNAGCEAMRAA